MNPKELASWMHGYYLCCGDIDSAVEYLKAALETVSHDGLPDDDGTEWLPARMARIRAFEAEYFNHPGAVQACWYMLNRLGLEEHGGGSPGWLTPLGKDLLSALKLYGTDQDEWEHMAESTNTTH
jgi:hypothetical protein